MVNKSTDPVILLDIATQPNPSAASGNLPDAATAPVGLKSGAEAVGPSNKDAEASQPVPKKPAADAT